MAGYQARRGSDDLSKTVDYGALANRLVRLAEEPPVRLIETLAERLAADCLSEPLVAEVEITVHKPHAPIAHPFSDVTVVIRRARPLTATGSGQPGPAALPTAARVNRRTVIAMGSNLGDRLDYLQGGLDGLFDTPRLMFLAVSPVYETAPVGGPEQPDYLNAVVIAKTSMPAQAVLERCHGLEDAFGRVRDERWGPRTLDLDLIIYGDEVSNGPD